LLSEEVVLAGEGMGESLLVISLLLRRDFFLVMSCDILFDEQMVVLDELLLL